jgi:hypothetical protein
MPLRWPSIRQILQSTCNNEASLTVHRAVMLNGRMDTTTLPFLARISDRPRLICVLLLCLLLGVASWWLVLLADPSTKSIVYHTPQAAERLLDEQLLARRAVLGNQDLRQPSSGPPLQLHVNVAPLNSAQAIASWQAIPLGDGWIEYGTDAANLVQRLDLDQQQREQGYVRLEHLTGGQAYFVRLGLQQPDGTITTSSLQSFQAPPQ